MKRYLSFLLFAVLVIPVGCVKDPAGDDNVKKTTNYYGNMFAYNMMKTYYLWEEEVSRSLENWTYKEDPFDKVKTVRYSMDKWTRLLDDVGVFLEDLSGNAKSFGMEVNLYYTDATEEKICAVVTYTYPNSPASRANLKRGDTILTLNGKEILTSNYATLVSTSLYGANAVRLGMSDGRVISLTAEQIYENAVQTALTLDFGSKKLGYLHFTGFTWDTCPDLESAFRQFKKNGINELVLDLRYNGGGYSSTCTVLASMIAPLADVKAEHVFTTDIYNKQLAEEYKDELDTPFYQEYEYESSSGSKKYKVRPVDVNPDIRKLWVITTDNSASASECLICGLKPYMDVTLVGEQTYGKFCGGYIIESEDFFDSLSDDAKVDIADAKKKTKGWGIYVMVSRYADKYGVTLSMPDGIPVDYAAKDNPLDGFQLGDPSETMLAKVLELSLGTSTKAPVSVTELKPAPPVRRPGFGVLLH